MSLIFKHRIALFNTLAVAIITVLVFFAIYFVVNTTAYSHLDEDILLEKEEVTSNLLIIQDSIIINKMPEWEEAEHSQVEVNPTFFQIQDISGKIIFRSANLLEGQLSGGPLNDKDSFLNGEINGQKIRLGQFLLKNDSGNTLGQITIAVSQQESHAILINLIWVLLTSFPIVLLVQFFASSIAASRSIKPVHQLIKTASGISDSNISTRLDLPAHKDELYQLMQTINDLLARIERSMIQQKQFTSDASHEIRTPLSAIRGTLEVLIRKPREAQVYEEKIATIIEQVDRLDLLLEQLLQIARIDSDQPTIKREQINLSDTVSAFFTKCKKIAGEKNITIHQHLPKKVMVWGDKLYIELILANLINNGLKYGNMNGNLFLNWDEDLKTLSIKDDGIGISEENLPKVFDRFYRADASRSSKIKGNGLGLSIVKKLAEIQNIKLEVESSIGIGTTFNLQFPSSVS